MKDTCPLTPLARSSSVPMYASGCRSAHPGVLQSTQKYQCIRHPGAEPITEETR